MENKNIYELLEKLKEIYGSGEILSNLAKWLPTQTVAEFLGDFIKINDLNIDTETGENFKINIVDDCDAIITVID